MSQLTRDEQKKQKDFDEEIIPHMDALYNFALRLTTDPNDAEDLVQDTIVKAYRFFSSYEKGTNAKAWMFRILKNSFINNYRKTSKKWFFYRSGFSFAIRSKIFSNSSSLIPNLPIK